MNKEQMEEKLDEMSDTIYGKVMRAYLEECVNDIDSVRGVRTLSEVLGRSIACKKMEKIINRLTPEAKSDGKKSEYE